MPKVTQQSREHGITRQASGVPPPSFPLFHSQVIEDGELWSDVCHYNKEEEYIHIIRKST